MGSAVTLAVLHRAPVVVSTPKVTGTWTAAGNVVAETPELRHTLVTEPPGHKALAVAVTTDVVTGRVSCDNSSRITTAGLAPSGVVSTQPVEVLFAAVTALAFYVLLAPALPSDHAQVYIGVAVTNTPFQGSNWVTVTLYTRVLCPDVRAGVQEVEGFAQLAVAAHGVVMTVVAHPTAHASRCQVHSHVEVAAVRMVVTVALFAGVWIVRLRWPPGQVVVEIFAEFTV